MILKLISTHLVNIKYRSYVLLGKDPIPGDHKLLLVSFNIDLL